MWQVGEQNGRMRCKVNEKKNAMQTLKGLFFGLAAWWLAWLLAGCSQVRYVETVRTDSVLAERLARDSVYLRDSVYVDRWTEGDTVYVAKETVRHEYRERLRTDTVAVVRERTVEVPVEVEKPLGWWAEARLKLFWPLAAVVVALAGAVAWMARRLA